MVAVAFSLDNKPAVGDKVVRVSKDGGLLPTWPLGCVATVINVGRTVIEVKNTGGFVQVFCLDRWAPHTEVKVMPVFEFMVGDQVRLARFHSPAGVVHFPMPSKMDSFEPIKGGVFTVSRLYEYRSKPYPMLEGDPSGCFWSNECLDLVYRPVWVVGSRVTLAHMDYNDDKYRDGAAKTVVPADLPPGAAEEMAELALRTYRALRAEGLARVDMFYDEEGRGFVVNEINTFPGFTPISMFPMLWAASGLSYPELLDEMIRLALDRQARRRP